jgi:outer membrane protein assembly factor BamD (BamD/ComL family)
VKVAPTGSDAAQASETAEIAEQARPVRATNSATRQPGSRSPVAEREDLKKELALLDQVRALLGAEQGKSASRMLAKYRSQFPHGRLSQEATVLEVQSLKAQGKSDKAEVLSREFIKQNPDSTHRKQLDAPAARTP